VAVRSCVRALVVAVAAVLAAGCAARGGSAVVPADTTNGASTIRRPQAALGSWPSVALVAPIGTVGGATATSTGVWVSDASSGALERITNAGTAVAYKSGAPHVYGLAPGPQLVAFDTDTGYGGQPDTGSPELFPVTMPHGETLVPGEITFYQAQEVIFLGGYATIGSTCYDAVYVFQAEGTTPFGYFGDPGATPCGVSLHHLTSDGNNLWFSESNTTPKYLSYFTPGAEAPVDYLLPAAASSATPEEVTSGPDGDVYFSLCGAVDTRPGGGAYLVRVNASSPEETLFSTYAPCASTTNSMTYDSFDGRVWIANGTNTLTAVRVTDGSVSSYTLVNPSSATSGFVAVTIGPNRSQWAFRNGDALAHAYPDEIIAADPSYAYAPTGQPVTITVGEYKYTGGFTAHVVSGSSSSCTVTPVTATPQVSFKVASPPHTACTVAFSDTNGVGTVYVPLVTAGGSNIPPQPQPQP
jgi:hypothetical protein